MREIGDVDGVDGVSRVEIGDVDGVGGGSRTADELAAALDLRPLPDEGGMFRRTYIDERSSAILYLLTADDFSALHRLPGPELWHFHAGSPLRFLLLHPDGTAAEPILDATTRPQLVVAGGSWQAAATTGGWTLVGTTMSPPYRDDDVEFGDRAALLAAYPGYSDHIVALTREAQ